jgi:hypothetical protein
MTRRLLLTAALVAALPGCRAAKPAAASGMTAPPPVARPLAPFTGQRVAVLPAQRLRPADSAAWGAQVPATRAYLGVVDSALAATLGERGLSGAWALPADVIRSAKRNVTYAADPYALAVNPLLPSRRPASTPDVPDPLATQLRTLVALNDARYALVPVELRFERQGGPTGAGRAVLRVAMLDARSARIAWAGDVASDTASALTPALAASAATHFADLIAEP